MSILKVLHKNSTLFFLIFLSPKQEAMYIQSKPETPRPLHLQPANQAYFLALLMLKKLNRAKMQNPFFCLTIAIRPYCPILFFLFSLPLYAINGDRPIYGILGRITGILCETIDRVNKRSLFIDKIMELMLVLERIDRQSCFQ